MDTSQTRELVERYYTALQTGDIATLNDVLHEDIRWEPPASAPIEPIEGGAAVAQALGADVVKQTFDISKPFELEIRKMVCEGDTAVVQQRLSATARATGRPYENQYCWVYTCADGKIVGMEEYADTLLAARVMGWDLEG